MSVLLCTLLREGSGNWRRDLDGTAERFLLAMRDLSPV